jgi:hypothetical protein
MREDKRGWKVSSFEEGLEDRAGERAVEGEEEE